ncbi:amidohydrolase family protein [Marisediminicola sp. LYQ134]|uniref:amidohydrolase n=1 Tax=unclassified Marisediminicola TaxID=2618316 RepID=UPI0039831749
MSLVLRDVRVVGGSTDPVDVLLKHGVVTDIGPGLTGTAEVSAGGRWMIPGLWDEHVHASQAALTRRRVDVSLAASAADAAAIMAAAPAPEHGLPLVGYGFRDSLWPDLAHRAVLDDVVAGYPVVIVSADLHCCWLNSAALAHFGLDRASDGVLREEDAFPVTSAVQNVPATVLDGWVEAAMTEAAGRGIVGIVDLEMRGAVADWSRRFAAGFRTVRVDAGVYPAELDAALAAGLRSGLVVDGSAGRLRVGPFKVITDGSLNTRTALCVDAYPGSSGAHAHGQLTVETDRLIDLLRRATAGGFTSAVHAIGDEANRLALDAFEAAGCGGRIEHAQLVRDADFDRFARLGVGASVQPEHAMDDREVADVLWHGRTDRAFALRRLVDAGVTLVLGSDAPVAPLDPWVTIAAATSRSRDGLEPWHPEQRLSFDEALTASTRGRSRVEVGDVGDLVLVDIDPSTAKTDELRSMPVAATMVDGYFTHSRL